MEKPAGGDERLDSWKEIAWYLRSSVRTVQRWEKTEALPVHRQIHNRQGTIFAYKTELDAWLESRSALAEPVALRADARPSDAAASSGAAASDWHGRVAAARAGLRRSLGAREHRFEPGTEPRSARSGAIVGRQRELGELLEDYEAVTAGRPRVVCIGGEAGVGKSTLVTEFIRRVRLEREPAVVARGRCSERLAGSEAYLPILDALDGLIDSELGEAAGELLKLVAPSWYVQVVPLWTAADASFARIADEAKHASRERLKRELGAFIDELAEVRPVVLFLDDLHWADPSTVELIAYLAKSAEQRRVLIAGTYRSTELRLSAHPFLDVRNELQAQGLCHEHDLARLDEQSVARFVALSFPGNVFPYGFVRLVHRRSGGNPLFMVDLLRELVAAGSIGVREGHWVVREDLPSLEAHLPESARLVIDRKIGLLDDEDRRLLAAASVQGHEFDSAVVAGVTGRTPTEIERRLRDLDTVYGLVSVTNNRALPDGTISLRCEFGHALYKNALYAGLTPSERAASSGAVATALVEHYGETAGSVAASIALLFEHARQPAEAARYYLEAAAQASRVSAQREALALIDRANDQIDSLAGDARQRLLLRAALLRVAVHLVRGAFDETIRAARDAEAAAVAIGDFDARIEAILGAVNASFLAKRMDESRAEANRALELVREQGDELALAAVETMLARDELCQGLIPAAEERYDRIVPILRRGGGSKQAMEAVGFCFFMHGWTLDYDRIAEHERWWLEQSSGIGGRYPPTYYFYASMAQGNAGEMGRGLALAEEGLRAAELNEDPYHYTRLPNVRGWMYRELGDVERAVTLDRQSAKLGREHGSDEATANALVNLAHDHMILGERESALECLNTAEVLFRSDVWFRWRYYIRLQAEYAAFWIGAGDLDRAARFATESVERARATKSRKHVAWGHKLLADVAVLEDRMERADELYAAAIAALEGRPCPTIEWRIFDAHAKVAAALHDESRAAALRAAAAKRIERLAASAGDEGLARRFLCGKSVRAILS
jgi:tetratricopeptide (TPR) repeat protein